jgi:protein involved in polysaccharide export with SLBB domain
MRHNILRVCATVFLIAAGLCAVSGQEKPAAAIGPPAQTNPPDVATDSAPSSEPKLAQRYPRYLLRPSDVLQLTFPITPEFDQTISIQPDGFVSLRGVGDLYIQGKSLPELSEALHKVYGSFLNDPIINIEMKDFEKPYFTAGGEFGRPGKYELRGDTTVTEAVAIAGGFTDKAKHSEVLVFRKVPGGWQAAKRLDVKQMLINGDLGEDVHLRPGDLIYVPKNIFSKLKQFIPTPQVGFPIP